MITVTKVALKPFKFYGIVVPVNGWGTKKSLGDPARNHRVRHSPHRHEKDMAST